MRLITLGGNSVIWLIIAIGMNWYSYLFYLYSAYFAIPFTLAVLYRFLHPHFLEGHASKLPPSSPLDYFFRALLLPFAFYYICDVAVLLYLYEKMDVCNLVFLLHHLVSLFGLPVLGQFPYFPWFSLAPIAFHCFLIWFPQAKWLEYIYVGLILVMYIKLMQKPWIQHRLYRLYFWTAVVIFGVLFMFWWFSCSNAMDNTII
jgi:hypothetical protein